MNRFLILALFSVCVYAEVAKFSSPFSSFQDEKPEKHLRDTERPNFLWPKNFFQRDTTKQRSDTHEFSPVSIPCSFFLTYNDIMSFDDERESVACNGFLAKKGNSISFTQTCNNSEMVFMLYRDDLSTDGYHIPYLYGSSDKFECLCSKYYEELDKIDGAIKGFIGSLEPFQYDHFDLETVDGITYYVFYSGDGSTYYVNESRFVSRIVTEYSSYKEDKFFEFNFDEIDNEWFKFDNATITCCDDDSFFETPTEIVPCVYPALVGMDFITEKMECNFTLDAVKTIDDEEPVHVKISMANSREHVFAEETVGFPHKQILRQDIGRYNAYPIFIGDADKCESRTGTDADALFMEVITTGLFTLVYDAGVLFTYSEAVACGDDKCTKYCTNSSKLLCLTTRDTEPHYPVGIDFLDLTVVGVTGFPRVSLTNISYGIVSDENVFKLDNTTYPGCENPEAYKVPELHSCKSEGVLLQLSPLPVSFSLTVSHKTVENGSVKNTVYAYARASDSIGILYMRSDELQVGCAYRGDFATDPDQIPGICGSSDSCDVFYFNEAKVAEDLLKMYNKSVGNNDVERRYGQKTTMMLDNAFYTVYSDEDSDGNKDVVYVDENGFLAKIERIRPASDYTYTAIFNYTLDSLDMSFFKFDTSFSSKCPEEFYEDPVSGSLRLDDPTQTKCAVAIEAARDVNGEHTQYQFSLIYQDRDQLPLLVMELNNSKNIFRGDLMEPGIVEGLMVVPLITGTIEGDEKKCLFQKIKYDDFLDVLESFDVYFNEFVYATKEEMKCGEEKCIKYCKDRRNTTCVYISDSETPYLMKSESREGSITYKAPVEVKDMTVFVLDKNVFPGCEDHATAYEELTICPPEPSSSIPSSTTSSASTPSSTNIHSSSTTAFSKSLSAASTIHVGVAVVLLAVAVALL